MKWEYLQTEIAIYAIAGKTHPWEGDDLDSLGQEGWELCGIIGARDDYGKFITAHAFLKRPIPEPTEPGEGEK